MFNFFSEFGDPFHLEEDEFLVAMKAHLSGENPREAYLNYLKEKVQNER